MPDCEAELKPGEGGMRFDIAESFGEAAGVASVGWERLEDGVAWGRGVEGLS